jgi:hypothetical protein
MTAGFRSRLTRTAMRSPSRDAALVRFAQCFQPISRDGRWSDDVGVSYGVRLAHRSAH